MSRMASSGFCAAVRARASPSVRERGCCCADRFVESSSANTAPERTPQRRTDEKDMHWLHPHALRHATNSAIAARARRNSSRLDGEERGSAKRWQTPASLIQSPGTAPGWSKNFADGGDAKRHRDEDPQHWHPRHRQREGAVVGRRHLQCDDVVGRRFIERRLVAVEIVNVTAVQHRLVMMVGDVRMHGIERHQREAENHQSRNHECEATHSGSLSPAPPAVPAVCRSVSSYAAVHRARGVVCSGKKGVFPVMHGLGLIRLSSVAHRPVRDRRNAKRSRSIK